MTVYRCSGRFGDDLLDEIRSRSDIVAVIGEYVELKKRGANFLGLCPFHQEKTPSFTVSPDKQMFYCFGCQTGGNVFSFLMKREGLSFTEAVELLANRAGIALPETGYRPPTPEAAAATDSRKRERELLYKVLEFAARYYHKALLTSPEAEKARAYLSRRGIKPESLETFRLGYSPRSWDSLLKALTAKGVDPAVLEKAGLVLRGKARATGARTPDAPGGAADPSAGAPDGSAGAAVASALGDAPGAAPGAPPTYYDRFRGRLMFPISDQRGRPIGFGARALDDGEEPKYLNSPETPLFSKGRGLYALNLAGPNIRRAKMALVVEGYMDVITCHEYGFDFAVASMGTAFTAEQARSLSRLTDTVVTAFDADAAGTQATIRGLEILTTAGFKVRVAEIPGGKDPDECLRASPGQLGPSAFREAVERAVPLAEYRYRLAVRRHDTATIDGRVAAVREIVPVLATITSPVERDEYLRDFAKRLPVAEDALRKELGDFIRASAAPRRRGVRDAIEFSRQNKERSLGIGGAEAGPSQGLRAGLDVAASRDSSRGTAGPGTGPGAPPPRRVLDAEIILLGLMLASEEDLHKAIGELLEAADWCRKLGLGGGEPAAAANGCDPPPTDSERDVLGWFHHAETRRVAREILRFARSEEPVSLARLLGGLTGADDIQAVARAIFKTPVPGDEAERAIRDCLGVLKEYRLNSRIEELHRRISELERGKTRLDPQRPSGSGNEEEYARASRILLDLIREEIELRRCLPGSFQSPAPPS